ncbi:MAG: beta-lactamase family protein [Clostridia bacterium]|nr:beta-lactamase family protein [Clostridia bacterium]
MYRATPEEMGISSSSITAFIRFLEDNRIPAHDLLLARGDALVYEGYWKPFDAAFCHRMYSVSKSLVALAVGFAWQDGLIDLDERIFTYFPAESAGQTDENMARQTVRHMLMMSTAKDDGFWFADKPADRVRYYFENSRPSRPCGCFFRYDSAGSFVLCALVERRTGKSFMAYMREKLFDKIGVSENITCLQCPGGHSWGDSAVICPPVDILKIARFTMNGGSWNGEQILDRTYVETAVSKQIDNDYWGENLYNTQGYGYLIWRTFDNSYFFNGMGAQLAVCVPDKDIILMFNGDTQGHDPVARNLLMEAFFRLIVRPAANMPLPVNAAGAEELATLTASLRLIAAAGESYSPLAAAIDGVTYHMAENPMGITSMHFTFTEDGGVWHYINAQGEKTLPFGLCQNVFGEFPQDGYADEIGTVSGQRRYACAASAAWTEPHKLALQVQIIDTYFGNLHAVFTFGKADCCVVMQKAAEDFLDEYAGEAVGYVVTE